MKIKESVLVLNKSWIPIHIVDIKRAMGLVCQQSAMCLDRDFVAYDFDDWIGFSHLEKTYPTVNTVKYKIAIPEIILLKKYNQLPTYQVKYNRQSLFEIHSFKCCYCGQSFKREHLTIDHVIPRSKGGTSDYLNSVPSCKPCNFKKSDKTPDEAKMKMFFKPKKPKWISPASKITMIEKNETHRVYPYESWKHFWNRVSVNF